VESISILMPNLFIKTLPHNTLKLVEKFQHRKPQFLENFYLSGGTALSLLMGHRESEDLDFFNINKFDPIKLQAQLENYGKLQNLELGEGTLNAYLDEVKLQFLRYPYQLIEPVNLWKNLQISSKIDIACTKLQTVSIRGSKKDFVDIYFLLQEFSLLQLFDMLKKKYPDSDYNQTHILKSLTFFDDAVNQPMPIIHRPVSWEQVQEKMVKTVKNFKF